jgi:hypothetical protein
VSEEELSCARVVTDKAAHRATNKNSLRIHTSALV